MNFSKYIFIFFLFLNSASATVPDSSSKTSDKSYPVSKFTIELAIGLKPYPISDVLVSNIAQWNINKRFSVISYTAYTHNNAFLRDFNYIKTDYNYSLTQKFGAGTSLYTNQSSHTFSFLAGVKYDTFKETLDNPEFEKVSSSAKSVSPDFALMYNLKVGKKKYFFSYRMVIPLYPYPFLTTDVYSIDGNMANVSLEFGVGVRL